MSVKILNKGKRTIIEGASTLAPDEVKEFTEEAANKLLRLYAGELLSLDDAVNEIANGGTPKAEAEPEQSEPAPAEGHAIDLSELKVGELKALLPDDIDVPAGTRKADLIKLVEQQIENN